MSEKVRPLRWTGAPLPYPHRGEEILLSHLWEEVYEKWPSHETCPETRWIPSSHGQEETYECCWVTKWLWYWPTFPRINTRLLAVGVGGQPWWSSNDCDCVTHSTLRFLYRWTPHGVKLWPPLYTIPPRWIDDFIVDLSSGSFETRAIPTWILPKLQG